MAVSFDSSAQGTAANPTTSISWSHTTASGAVLVVQAITLTTNSVTSVTYNGNALTLVDTSNDGSLILTNWILLTPSSGTHTVVVNCTNGLLGADSQSYTGASTISNPSSFGHSNVSLPNGSAPTISLTNVTGGGLIGFAYKGNSNSSGIVGGTQRQHDAAITNGSWGDILGASSGSQAFTITFSVDGSGTNFANVQAMVLQPLGAPATPKSGFFLAAR